MTDSLGVGFRYDEIFELCQRAAGQDGAGRGAVRGGLGRGRDTRLVLDKEDVKRRHNNNVVPPKKFRKAKEKNVSVRIVGGRRNY